MKFAKFDANVWLHLPPTNYVPDPCREPEPEWLEPGDVDDDGRILTGDAYRPYVPFGRIWVRPDQARAAGYYGWEAIMVGAEPFCAYKTDGSTLHCITRSPQCFR